MVEQCRVRFIRMLELSVIVLTTELDTVINQQLDVATIVDRVLQTRVSPEALRFPDHIPVGHEYYRPVEVEAISDP